MKHTRLLITFFATQELGDHVYIQLLDVNPDAASLAEYRHFLLKFPEYTNQHTHQCCLPVSPSTIDNFLKSLLEINATPSALAISEFDVLYLLDELVSKKYLSAEKARIYFQQMLPLLHEEYKIKLDSKTPDHYAFFKSAGGTRGPVFMPTCTLV